MKNLFWVKSLQAQKTLAPEFCNNSTYNLEIYSASYIRVLFVAFITAVSGKTTVHV